MAVTGSGTQQDPYIVENWEDFLSVKASNITHWIKFADTANKVIDFNDIQPEGFDSPITMSGYFDFNGWEFRNMKFNSTESCFKHGRISGTDYPLYEIKNLKLTNFVWDASSNSSTNYLFYQYSSTPSSSNGCIVDDIRISGIINLFTNNSLYIFHNCYGNNTNFTLNVKLTSSSASNTSLIMALYKDIFQNCNLKFESENLFTIQLGNIRNSLIQGTLECGNSYQVLGFSSESNSNVILLNTSKDISYSGGLTIFNKDLAPNVTETNSLKGCTTEQLKDPVYLASIGFNIYGQVVS